MRLNGFHHLTAITADAPGNYAFYTQTLGLRLVKKTVNQDDTSAYHLFYADGIGSPGSDITFFDWPAGREKRGTHSICNTGLRIKGEAAFNYWKERFASLGLKHGPIAERDGRLAIDFEDAEGQRLSLVDDDNPAEVNAWGSSPVPSAFQIRGLGPITLSVPDLAPTDAVLTTVMSMEKLRTYRNTSVYGMNGVGPIAELHVREEPELPPAASGAGAVHHVAFNIPMQDYDFWTKRLANFRIPNSGPVDRFWFKSLYFREPNGILFELATDGPGFAADEPMEKLGETLSLPPFLEEKRKAIEARLKPLK
ncbi:MAG: ring-cleaving dioxygenase [Rhizobiales bacterium]|nr:ring-cleaving dioxygenase [Hyphomicrobiales bacterium]